MRYLSLFSGVEAASLAWAPLGWEAAAFAEIDPFCCALLDQRYPGVPNLGDVRDISEADLDRIGPVDLVVFGSPCQDFSIAGNRAGMKGERSSLFHDAVRVISHCRQRGARWALWENVLGVFSSHQGRDFAAVAGAMAGAEVGIPPGGWQNAGVCLGEHGIVEWAVLDAQHFGVPQRRRRVFALADFGNWRDRGPILFDAESVRRGFAPGRKAGQGCADTVTSRVGSRCRDNIGSMIANTVTASAGHPSLRGDSSDNLVFNPQAGGNRDFLGVGNTPTALTTKATPAVLVEQNQRGEIRSGNIAGALNTGGGKPGQGYPAVVSDAQIRRLTPRECERLQGMLDDWTLVEDRGKPAADAPRYRAIGNSMAVPVMRWIGEQIAAEQSEQAREA